MTATAICEPKRSLSKAATKFGRDARQAQEAADEHLLNHPHGEPLGPELVALIDWLGWDQRRIDRERGRLEQVALQLADAGSNGDFQEATANLSQVEKTDAVERAKVQETFDKARRAFEQKIGALDSQLSAARRPVEKMSDARERLRSKLHLPEFVLKEFDAARSCARRDLSRRESELQQRLRLCEAIPRLNVNDKFGNDMVTVRSYARLNLPEDHPAQPFMQERGRMNSWAVNETAWQAHCRELQAERPAIEEELSHVRQQLAGAEAAVAKLLDYYVDRYC